MERCNSSNMISCALAFLVGVAATYGFYRWKGMGGSQSMDGSHCSISEQRCALRTNMRKLWADHVFWTRDYIIAAVAASPDAPVAAERLLRNQDDIGAAVGTYYGKEAGDALAALLREHIMIAAALVTAAVAKDDAGFKLQDKKWHANAVDISTFLSKANPALSFEDLKKMFDEHLALTTAEVVARLKGDWKKDVATFDEIFTQANDMADHLTAGIAKQFPAKF